MQPSPCFEDIPIHKNELVLASTPESIIDNITRSLTFTMRSSYEEWFCGHITGSDIDKLLGAAPGEGYRKNDTRGNTRLISFNELFQVSRSNLSFSKDLKVIYHAAVVFIFSSVADEVTLEDIVAGLQCNVNLYTSNSQPAPHQDDSDDKARTFYPASATVAFSDSGPPPEFKLWYPKRNNSGQPSKRTVYSGTPHDDIATGNGVLFGLREDSYLFGKHAASVEGLGRGRRLSFNFRSVRREVREQMKNRNPTIWPQS